MKKIAILAVLILFAVSAQAETLIYGSVEVPLKEGMGGGMVYGVGQQINKNWIGWINGQAYKTGTGETEVDNVMAGVTVLTDPVIGKRGGFFLTLEAGAGKVAYADSSEPLKFANMNQGGLYFDLSKETTLWVGGSYTKTQKVSEASVFVGVSMNIKWR